MIGVRQFLAGGILLACASVAYSAPKELIFDRKNLDLGEPHGPKVVSVSCRWEKTLVIKLSGDGPEAVLSCSANGPGVRVESSHH